MSFSITSGGDGSAIRMHLAQQAAQQRRTQAAQTAPAPPASPAQKMLTEHHAKVDEIRSRYETTVQRIRDHRGLTPEAKRGGIARAYEETQAALSQLAATGLAAIENHRRNLVDRAWGGKTSDPQAAMAQRQANQMVNSVTDHHQLAGMLRQAQQDGDHQLAKTVAGQAWSNGYTDIVDQWNHDGAQNSTMRLLIEHKNMPKIEPFIWGAEHSVYPAREIEGLSAHRVGMEARADYSGGDAA
ncbi:hypothetical protein [Actinacidiphila sp. ITFR-21]|uniref:hypothetical protein n=1 Tax=Actinacidiphila sp. ITFR-21 TaxID=3075199 RepID=UPI00288AEB23|nr:hypothetical protein [Streptomyces sp. ITFR-21]WNI15224.1 hypothetical protein RLT57_06525 [Streptomyces sp. ITFR-21]